MRLKLPVFLNYIAKRQLAAVAKERELREREIASLSEDEKYKEAQIAKKIQKIARRLGRLRVFENKVKTGKIR